MGRIGQAWLRTALRRHRQPAGPTQAVDTDPSDADIEAALRATPVEAIDRLADAARALQQVPTDSLVSWAEPRRADDGTLHVGYPVYAAEVDALIAALYDADVIIAFDWPRWIRHSGVGEPDRIAQESVADLARFITAVVRSERFGDGAMVPHLQNRALADGAARIAAWAGKGHGPEGSRARSRRRDRNVTES